MQIKSLSQLTVVLLFIFCFKAGDAFSQASPVDMSNFPMPPINGYVIEKEFQPDTFSDTSYELIQDYAPSDVATFEESYAYFKYSGIGFRKINILPAFVNDDIIPPATKRSDACGHTHLSYGVWIRYSFTAPYLGAYNASYYKFVGGGGMSGVRDRNGNCVHEVENPLSVFGPAFGWGSEFTSFWPPYMNYSIPEWSPAPILFIPMDVIVGVSAPAHGWGTCDDFLCYEPVRSNVWLTPM